MLFAKIKLMNEEIHAGHLIREVLKEKGHTVSWFAQKVNRERSTIYTIFENPHIHTSLLLQVSIILEYDFFQYFSDYFIHKQ